MMKYLIILCLIVALASCDSNNRSYIKIESDNTQIDSIYITESITERIVKAISTNGDELKIPIDIDSTTVGIIKTRDGKHSYLTILRPHKNITVQINSDSTILTNNIADSLLNYLWKSNNEFIADKGQFIFTTNNLDSVISLFEEFRTTRKNKIENQSNKLTTDEKELLLYQNDARINSFLFFYGRISKKLPPSDSYFRFVNDINNNTKWTKSLPQNLLYKHEINYLINYDSLTNINSFLSYIESQTSNKDLLAFLKAIYIRGIIEQPFYWERHQTLFDSEILRATLQKENENPYYDLIQRSSDNYFSSQKGIVAYDFTAERIDGTKLRLSDLKGKIVFIDNWASWCGPCISERPNVLELANRFKDNPRVEILMISVDASRDAWIKYLTKRDQLGNHGDVIIKNGMRTKYGDSFNVKFIPKYILIDKNGVIIDSDIPGPSKAVIDLIEKELKSM